MLINLTLDQRPKNKKHISPQHISQRNFTKHMACNHNQTNKCSMLPRFEQFDSNNKNKTKTGRKIHIWSTLNPAAHWSNFSTAKSLWVLKACKISYVTINLATNVRNNFRQSNTNSIKVRYLYPKIHEMEKLR